MSNSLFEKAKLGQFTLQNRVVMAPMTRSRAIGNTPNESLARHYGDRATAGLIITEGTSPSPNGLGYARIPGLFNLEQATAWKQVTDSVHKKGGHIFVQLMHTGRVSHPANLPKGAQILAPSAVATPGEMWTDAEGMKSYPVPTAMTEAQIEEAIQEYAASAKLALEAGFDGIELHSANGYLMDQFLNTATNQRQDRWGGSIQNRIRFAVEVAKATVKAVGGQHVGIRVSPYGAFNGTQADPEMDALYVALAQELSALGLVYIHIVDHSSMGAPPVSSDLKAKIRENFKGATILSGGYDAGRAQHDLDEKRADLIAFGRPFISNPNLVEKLKTGSALVTPDYDTFYTPGDKGYNDYSA
jgi:N-ethylmaleimide reductase